MYDLPEGTHKVKVELVFDIPKDETETGSGYGEPKKYQTKFGKERVIAQGEFDINITSAGKIAAGKKLCPKNLWLKDNVKAVPDAFNMVNSAKRETEKILKVVVYDGEWTYIKNAFGVILSRKTTGKAIAQDLKSKLCYEIDLEFSQVNTSSGGSGYGKTQFTRSGDMASVPLDGRPIFLEECIK